MKRSTLARLLATLALLPVLLAPLEPAYAGWKFGDTRYFSAEQVCRDGMIVLAGWDKIGSGLGDPVPGDTSEILLGARLYTNTDLPVSPPSNRRIEDYGPLLAPERVVLMTYHETPIVADINDDGLFVLTFFVYARETWTWSQLLDVGQTVLLHEGNIIHEVQVTDCFLHRPSVGRGGSTALDGAILVTDPRISPADTTLYQIDALPSSGRLLLNGVEIGVGDQFSQADVNAGRLRYAHDGSSTMSDSFQFSVSGLSRVSIASDGSEAFGGASTDPSISADGSLIAFESTAINLVDGDTNGQSDIFLRDTHTISTTRISRTGTGAQATGGGAFNPSISASGRDIAFESTATNMNATDCSVYLDGLDAARDVYRYSFGSVFQVSKSDELFGNCYRGNGNSSAPAMASDSFSVAFQTNATNMLAVVNGGVETAPADANGPASDVYKLGTFMQLQSHIDGFSRTQADAASSSPAITDNGEIVVFDSAATNLLGAGADTNGISDIYVSDSSNDAIRVSVATNGVQATSTAQSCLPLPCTTLGSYDPDITPDGRFIVFRSYANNLVSGDNDEISDIFVRDRDTDSDGNFDEPGAVSTRIVSVATGGAQGNANSFSPSISSDGRFVAYRSLADNLVPGDTNSTHDIFLHDRDSDGDGVFDEPGAIRTTRISVAADGTEATGGTSNNPAISHDGMFVAFDSIATNLVPGDTNGQSDVFVAYTGYRSTLLIEVTDARVALPLVVRPAP